MLSDVELAQKLETFTQNLADATSLEALTALEFPTSNGHVICLYDVMLELSSEIVMLLKQAVPFSGRSAFLDTFRLALSPLNETAGRLKQTMHYLNTLLCTMCYGFQPNLADLNQPFLNMFVHKRGREFSEPDKQLDNALAMEWHAAFKSVAVDSASDRFLQVKDALLSGTGVVNVFQLKNGERLMGLLDMLARLFVLEQSRFHQDVRENCQRVLSQCLNTILAGKMEVEPYWTWLVIRLTQHGIMMERPNTDYPNLVVWQYVKATGMHLITSPPNALIKRLPELFQKLNEVVKAYPPTGALVSALLMALIQDIYASLTQLPVEVESTLADLKTAFEVAQADKRYEALHADLGTVMAQLPDNTFARYAPTFPKNIIDIQLTALQVAERALPQFLAVTPTPLTIAMLDTCLTDHNYPLITYTFMHMPAAYALDAAFLERLNNQNETRRVTRNIKTEPKKEMRKVIEAYADEVKKKPAGPGTAHYMGALFYYRALDRSRPLGQFFDRHKNPNETGHTSTYTTLLKSAKSHYKLLFANNTLPETEAAFEQQYAVQYGK